MLLRKPSQFDDFIEEAALWTVENLNDWAVDKALGKQFVDCPL
jgi:hypothetical protein